MKEISLAISTGFTGRTTLAMAAEWPSGNKTRVRHAARAYWPHVAAVAEEQCYMEQPDKLPLFDSFDHFSFLLTKHD